MHHLNPGWTLVGLVGIGLAVGLTAWAAGAGGLAIPPRPAASATGAKTPADRPGWRLVWADEFDGSGLPDPKEWTYEEGKVRNNEAQYYTKARAENCRIERGMLILEARKEPFTGPRGRGDYTSASIETKGLGSWQYGRLEMRARLPQGLGVWPAFWTLGAKGGWPACGEIDIMEFVGHDPNKTHGTLHWRDGGKHASKGGHLAVSKPWEAFHVYAVEWSADRIDFFYDDTKFNSIALAQADDNGSNAFRQPHYLKLNLALGGSWGGKIDDTVLPQRFIVDYVRVYQRKDVP
ncbi:MAG: glycoside hydrolase family 16 protein [Spirochaetes bacterium]|nr:glycoside hydrolase family 16 protein [Spirochaetota bacterium]